MKTKLPKINIKEILFIVYCWVEKSYLYNIDINSVSSLSSIKRIKRCIIEVIKDENKNTFVRLGPDYPVQIDESIIVKGKLITSPSNKYDEIKDAVWIMCAVEEQTRKVIPNRKKNTFISFMQRYVSHGTQVKTDGHKSYPYAVAGIKGSHVIVNHEEGFLTKQALTLI